MKRTNVITVYEGIIIFFKLNKVAQEIFEVLKELRGREKASEDLILINRFSKLKELQIPHYILHSLH